MFENAKMTRRLASKNALHVTATVGAVGCLVPTEVFAAASGAQAQNPLGAGLFVAWGIAYLTRRRAIGGWLLYFYIQLYLSLLVSLLFIPQVISNLSPGEWDSAIRYVLFFLGTVPVLLAEGFEAYAATKLLITRNETNLRLLRRALAVLVVTSGVSLAIDIFYFSEAPSIVFDVLTFAFAAIWTAYFMKAKRVRLVFVEQAWDYAAQATQRHRSPEEKRYLRRRAALVSVITFVVLLVMMSSAIGDKKPDAGIFFVPVFYALIAAAIGWYAPIRKKKLDTLLSMQVKNQGE